MAEVSVIVPVYDVEPYLRQCVDSILGQTLRDIEIVLVDDCSPDGCPAICDEYAAKDSRVKVLHKENGGVSSARKAGLLAATAPYVGFVDADDWVDPGFFEELYSCAKKTDSDIVAGQHINELPDGRTSLPAFVRSKTETWDGAPAIRRLTEQFLTCGWAGRRPFFNSCADKLFRRSLLLENISYFDEQLSMGEDLILILSLLPDCRRVTGLCPQWRYHYRQLESSAAHSYTEKRIFTVERMALDLRQIARDKSLDTAVVDACIGFIAYKRVFMISLAEGIPLSKRREDIKRILRMTPEGTLGAFAQAGSGIPARCLTALLRARLITPCIILIRTLQPRNRRDPS